MSRATPFLSGRSNGGRADGPTRRRARRLLAAVLLWAATASPAAAWWNPDWSFRKPITLDPAAAGLPAPGGRVLVLVRLHSGNFDFLAAKEDGSDLRFVAADDKTPLNFHIDSWNNLFELGLVWVDLPASALAGPTPSIWLYYGSKDALPAGDAKASFPPSTVLAWHMAQGALPLDSTAYANNATESTGAAVDGSYIGPGLSFAPGQTATLPASPSLAVPAGGALTFQAWLQPAALAPGAVLFEKTEAMGASRGLRIGLDGGTPFAELDGASGPQRVTGTTTLEAGVWHHLAVTAGAQLTLYLDGQPIGQGPGGLPALTGPANLGGPAPVLVPATPAAPAASPTPPTAPPTTTRSGTTPAAAAAVPAGPAAAAPATVPAVPPTPRAAYAGLVDELRLANVELGPAEIRWAALAERAESPLLAYGQDEENAGLDLGSFGPIIRNVTVDGWVVIAICGVLLVLSWWVMIAKAFWVNGIAAANQTFLRQFRALASDILALDHPRPGLAGKEAAAETRRRRAYARSPLYRLYHAGAGEVEKRVAGHAAAALGTPVPGTPGPAGAAVAPVAVATAGAAAGPEFALSPQSIAAIRATLDAILVRELQRANRYMVLLTIAISGGPFLGLLGTVVGVMITFASIAESGQVNVNAIAPGISAALLATVAGLAVAIPALFGYNYLVGRVKDVANDMQVFVDEFTTRIAEQFSR